MSDIVEQLKEKSRLYGSGPTKSILLEAADAIEALRRERDGLSDLCSLMQKSGEDDTARISELLDQLAAMTADQEMYIRNIAASEHALAAEQAYSQQLWEALEKHTRYSAKIGTRCVYCHSLKDDGHSKDCAIGRVLALPHNTDALNAWGAKLLRGAAAYSTCFDKMQFFVSYLNRTADKLEGKP